MNRCRTQFRGETSVAGIVTRCYWILASMPVIVALSACGTEKSASVASNDQIHQYSDDPAVREKHTITRSAMPINGKAHISQKGNFIVDTMTMFCVADRHLDKIADYASLGGTHINEYLHQAGQSDKYDGGGRIFFDKCPAAKGAIRISRTLSLNDEGKPYKISWIAIQNEARLELSLQRDANDKRHWPMKPNQYSTISGVITHDGDSISEMMASILFQRDSK